MPSGILEKVHPLLMRSTWVDEAMSLIHRFMSNEKWYQDKLRASYQIKFKGEKAKLDEQHKALTKEIRLGLNNIGQYEESLKQLRTPGNNHNQIGITGLTQQLDLLKLDIRSLEAQSTNYLNIVQDGSDYQILFNTHHYAAATSNRTLAGTYANATVENYIDQLEETQRCPVTTELAKTMELKPLSLNQMRLLWKNLVDSQQGYLH